MIVSVSHLAHCLAHNALSRCLPLLCQKSLWQTGSRCVLSVEDTGACSSLSLSSPGPSPVSFFPFLVPQALVSSFSNPTHNSERMEENRLVYFETKFNIDPQKKNNLCNTLYYHISATFKQSLSDWTENYRPAGRHKLEGLPVWKRGAQQLAGLYLWGGEAQLLALCIDFVWKIVPPFSLHRQGKQ